VDAIIICVPTPLNKNREPDISYIIDTGKSIARHLRKGMLVVLESTTYPGTTDEDLRAVLEIGSGLEAGRDFHLAFSPEREDPGNPDSKVALIPKVVGGYTPACLKRRSRSTPRRLRQSCPCHPVGRQRRPSCSKTPFAV
jgi:UDP-N-acetyl-D-glucosamine dehydrogenase